MRPNPEGSPQRFYLTGASPKMSAGDFWGRGEAAGRAWRTGFACLPAGFRALRRGEDARCALIRVSLCRANPSTVKTRRYKQDAKDKAFRRGAYSNVRDPRKTQSDNVLRSRYAFRSVERIRQPLKRGNTSKTRRTRLSAGERTQMYVTQGKRSPTMYCAADTRFP